VTALRARAKKATRHIAHLMKQTNNRLDEYRTMEHKLACRDVEVAPLHGACNLSRHTVEILKQRAEKAEAERDKALREVVDLDQIGSKCERERERANAEHEYAGALVQDLNAVRARAEKAEADRDAAEATCRTLRAEIDRLNAARMADPCN